MNFRELAVWLRATKITAIFAYMQSLHPIQPSKFQRYRLTQKKRGMKLIRLWVPDPGLSTFCQAAKKQARLLYGKPEEKETLDFIEKIMTHEMKAL